jgi:tetratricopeptide (TPR) repeat protein
LLLKKTGFVFLIVLAAISITQFYCTQPNVPLNVYLNHNDTVKYVGIMQCASCHYDIYQSFIQTGMGQSFAPATKQKSVADFNNHKPVFDKFNNMYYYPFWVSDTMFISEFRLNGKDTIYKRVERVDYIIGSGQHTNSHLTNINGYIYQLPLTWYSQLQKWDLPPGFENGRNVRFSRNIALECMSCHNAMPVVEPKSDNKFISIGNGIDCERCHGPGELHVKEKLAGKLVDTATQIDYTIVNPKKLSWQLQVDVCQRCHLQGNAILKPGKSFTDFKPGMHLSEIVDVYMPSYASDDNSFIMASHAQRLQLSKCFIESNKQSTHINKTFTSLNLTCITCHNPHVSVKVTGKQIFNNACIKCHTNGPSDCSENPQQLLLRQNNCVGCHMPKNGTEDIPHVTVHDHYIRKPVSKQAANNLKTFVGLYCVNNNQPNANNTKAAAYLNYIEKFEGDAAAIDSAWWWINQLNTNEIIPLKIQYHFLLKQFDKIIALSTRLTDDADAWTCYRIGQAMMYANRYNEAEKWYRKAVKAAPYNLDFINKLGAALVKLNQINEAIEVFTSSLKLQPNQEDAWINKGFALVKLNRYNQAMQCYNRALQLNPDNQQALFNRAALHYLNKNNALAKQDLKLLLQLDANNQKVKDLYNQLN